MYLVVGAPEEKLLPAAASTKQYTATEAGTASYISEEEELQPATASIAVRTYQTVVKQNWGHRYSWDPAIYGIPISADCQYLGIDSTTKPTGVQISPYSNDPPATAQPFYHDACPIKDYNADGRKDFAFWFYPQSLKDLSAHTPTDARSALSTPTTARTRAYPPTRLAALRARQVYPISYEYQYTVYNLPPTANPSATPSPPAWNSNVKFNANSSDPDDDAYSGPMKHRWRIKSHPRKSTIVELTNKDTANPTLQLGGNDIGDWSLRAQRSTTMKAK